MEAGSDAEWLRKMKAGSRVGTAAQTHWDHEACLSVCDTKRRALRHSNAMGFIPAFQPLCNLGAPCAFLVHGLGPALRNLPSPASQPFFQCSFEVVFLGFVSQ